MDLETENRIAAILLKEADELRRQAQKEGALAFLREPTVRSRPNSRFLTATVRGVQQANRVVEVNEMWRIRDKQLELENKLRGSRNKTSINKSYEDAPDSHRNRIRKCSAVHSIESTSNSSKKRTVEDLVSIDDEGLRDDEVEKFLHSRTKRGRGAVGSRMDDTGPYPHSCPDSDKNSPSEYIDEKLWRDLVKLGPEKPSSLKTSDSSDEEPLEEDYKKKVKKSSSKRHSKHHKSKEKSRDERKKRRDKKNNHDK